MVCVRRVVVVPILLLFLAFPAFAASKKGSTQPPKDLHQVGDHWTPYNPPDPATFPAGSKTHTIVAHDTLWALALKYYGNAYLWPQLWEANTYITDAHWIYPGDPLLIEGEVSTAGGTTTSTTTQSTETTVVSGDSSNPLAPTASGETPSAPAMTAQVGTGGAGGAGTPIAIGTQSDIYCWGYLGAANETLPNKISSVEDVDMKYAKGADRQDVGVTEGDIVYIAGGTNTGLVAGESYIVVTPEDLIHHPKSGAVVGRHYDFRGQVRILCASEERATAIVTQACNDILIGSRLKPVPQLPIPISRLTPMATVCSPSSGKASGFIVNSKDMTFTLGDGALVEVNLGKDEFVQPGDFLTVYRESTNRQNPPQLLGEIGILTSESHTATGRIVRMRYQMEVGDRVEVK